MIGLHGQPGIAFAPILFVIAILAVLVAAFGQGASMFGGSAITSDRIVAELRGQADMIRAKIEECVMVTRQNNGQVFLYPGDDRQGTPITVSKLDCPRDAAGQQNLWHGARPAILPPTLNGFTEWAYINHGDPADAQLPGPGGICIVIQPTAAIAANASVRDAIQKALKRYAPTEYEYSPKDPAQRIIFWLERPRSGNTC